MCWAVCVVAVNRDIIPRSQKRREISLTDRSFMVLSPLLLLFLAAQLTAVGLIPYFPIFVVLLYSQI